MNAGRKRGALLLGLVLLAAPVAADASAGRGASIGSRGSRTYVLPPRTSTSPFGAQPIQRTITPPPYRYGGPGIGPVRRHPFLTGFAAGLLGAGLGGLLFGHGLAGSVLGGLIEILLVFLLARWLIGRLRAGGSRTYAPAEQFPAQGRLAPASIERGDYGAFESILREVQRAWTMGDLSALGRVATPEMVGIFADQMRDMARRGVRNSVSEVKLEKGDLAEAWREGPEEFATVAMRYSAIDIDTDPTGRVLGGDADRRVTRTEYWTFVRQLGGSWMLSAIQQA